MMVKAMVPFFDMLNHNPTVKTQHGFDDKTGLFTFKTLQRIGKGEQVYLNYGPLSNQTVRA